MSNCLIELGTEELPPRALSTLSKAFSDAVKQGLASAGLKVSEVESFATPRRLAMLLKDVPANQEDQVITKRGPALQVAFDGDGQPTPAALGFARSCGVDVSDLMKQETDKGAWLFYQKSEKGLGLNSILPDIVSDALANLPIPKRMRWGDRAEEFVRPVHWLVMMVDDQLIEAHILGRQAGQTTRGHRFHAPQELHIHSALEYENILVNSAFVIPDFEKRKQIIREQVESEAKKLDGKVKMDAALLDEVTALVEWPQTISGKFDDEFLVVPEEVLVATMQDNQKYFAVFDADDQLLPHFITVSNIESKNPTLVSLGNERVIRPRFADAKFFWEQDKKVTLSSRLQSLDTVIFQHQLGSVGDKVIRIRSLAGYLAEILSANVSEAERAAVLCKCDLMTDMVGEFPRLQGIMGNYYALHDGESPTVATAIEQHYRPRYAGDTLPENVAGQCVALADRVDTMMGIFAIGQKPSGVKDPFGLRRSALGIIRILIENNLPVDIVELCRRSANTLRGKLNADDSVQDVVAYIFDRMKAYYQDQQIRFDVIDAVLACEHGVLTDLHHRIIAVNAFLNHESAPALAAANKRIGNILKKQGSKININVDIHLLQEDAEQALYQQMMELENTAMAHFNDNDYLSGLNELAALRPAVDMFFDKVMVMVDDKALKLNRLALLEKLAGYFLHVADFSRLQ